jgi:hypothetical protein
VGEYQRHRVRLWRADVQEVDVLAVDGGDELRELVELRLLFAPVVAVLPVLGKLFQVPERHAPAPTDAGQLSRPAGASQALPQIFEIVLRDLDPERADLCDCVVVHVDHVIRHCS